MGDREMLLEIKARCENWRECYKDRPSFQVSSLYHLMKYLEKYSPKYQPPPNRFNPSGSSKSKDYADAELLNYVWRGLDEQQDRLQVCIRFICFSLPMAEVKKIISVYTFSGKNYSRDVKQIKRRLIPVSPEDYRRIEDQSLLYFAKQVNRYN